MFIYTHTHIVLNPNNPPPPPPPKKKKQKTKKEEESLASMCVIPDNCYFLRKFLYDFISIPFFFFPLISSLVKANELYAWPL